MPQKFRQRGKKKSKKAQEEKGAAAEAVEQPAWTIDRGAGNEEAAVMEEDETAPAVEDGEAPEHIPIQEADLAGEQDRIDDVAPFGFVSPELKAYLKDAIASLHKMQAERDQDYEDGEEEPSEQLNLLRLAMLREMNGQELACATDGEASIALESVIEALDDRRLRILADRMSGSYHPLSGHRFGSHVLQALLRHLQRNLANDKGKGRRVDAGDAEAETSAGVLRTPKQLIFDLIDELTPHIQELLQSTFGTHVVRSMLQLLAGQDLHAIQRSKKSKAFRAKVQQHRGGASDAQDDPVASSSSLAAFPEQLKAFRHACLPKDLTGRNEARALLVSPSASPTFALLLSLEAQAGGSAQPGSLADIVLEGLITAEAESKDDHSSQDGVETLLRHPSGSHALEALLSHLPQRIASRFWSVYVTNKVTRLACHPVANFVVAAAAKRLDAASVREALEEIKEKQGGKMIKEGKMGVLLALVARAAWWGSTLPDQEAGLEGLAMEATLSAFGLDKKEDAKPESEGLIVKAILALKTKDGWAKMMRRRKEKKEEAERAEAAKKEEEAKKLEAGENDDDDGEDAGIETRSAHKRKRGEEGNGIEEDDGLSLRPEEATVQGSVVLQALVRLSEPHNHAIYESLLHLPTPLPYLLNPTTSHAYLSALSSPTRPYTLIRRLLTLSLTPLLLPHLADSKYGSRIADATWLRMDLFTREKFMKAHFASPGGGEERRLQGAFYGRHFLTKRLRVAEWHRDRFRWKDSQAELRRKEEEEERGRVRGLASEAEDAVVVRDDGEAAEAGGDEDEHSESSSSSSSKKKRAKKAKTTNETELDAIFAGV